MYLAEAPCRIAVYNLFFRRIMIVLNICCSALSFASASKIGTKVTLWSASVFGSCAINSGIEESMTSCGFCRAICTSASIAAALTSSLPYCSSCMTISSIVRIIFATSRSSRSPRIMTILRSPSRASIRKDTSLFGDRVKADVKASIDSVLKSLNGFSEGRSGFCVMTSPVKLVFRQGPYVERLA